MPYSPHEAARIQAILDSDPVVQGILSQLRGLGTARGSAGGATMRQLQEALRANPQLRAMGLGDPSMSAEYTVDPQTGQVGYQKGEWGNLAKTAAIGSAMALGGWALGSALPAAGGMTPAAEVAGIDSTIASMSPTLPAVGGSAATGVSRILPKIGKYASGIPAITSLLSGGSGSSGPFGGAEGAGLMDEIRENLRAQRGRFEASQPAFDTVQRMAAGMTPNAYRGPFGGGR